MSLLLKILSTMLMKSQVKTVIFLWLVDSQGQETFSAHSADSQTCNYGTRMLKPLSLTTNSKVKEIEPEHDETMCHIYKFTSKCYSQTMPSTQRRYRETGNVFSTLC